MPSVPARNRRCEFKVDLLSSSAAAGFAIGMRILIAIAITSVATAQEDDLVKADLRKLMDPAQRDAEVKRLDDCKDGQLVAYHFLSAPQREGKAPLHVLAVESSHLSSFSLGDGYKVEKPEKLFGTDQVAATAQLEPSLHPIQNRHLMVLDPKGREIRPFGGDNFISWGYCYDFNKDGVLERADYTNYSVDEAPEDDVQVFELQTIEAQPRSLLKVIYNWHPDAHFDKNCWSFTCTDEDKDGWVEIHFHPDGHADDPQRITFRWDTASKRYSAGALPPRSHVRVMAKHESLADIAKAGGLGYPIAKDPGSGTRDDATPPPQARYRFQSLKGKTAGEWMTFFNGTRRRDWTDGPSDSFANRIPTDLWQLGSKPAALSLAESNRTPSHRKAWKLAVDDRNGVTPPSSGWLVFDWGSSGCYSYSSNCYALHFGVREPTLTVFSSNSMGVVGHNPWADEPAYQVRRIQLEEPEARFMADTIFWLDRIRSHTQRQSESMSGGRSSTADGFATISLWPADGPPRQLAATTIWAMSSVSSQWEGEYNQTVFANLADLFMSEAVPQRLADRWKVANEIQPQSLMTPTRERIKPRTDNASRKRLTEIYGRILEQHHRDPAPATVLRELVVAAGQEALTELLDPLRKLEASIGPETAEDREFEILATRFARDHFGDALGDEPSEHKDAYARYQALRGKREFQASAVLREPLKHSFALLELAGHPDRLTDVAAGNMRETPWALTLRRRRSPDTWADILQSQFNHAADDDNRRAILHTLAEGSIEHAKRLIARIPAAKRRALIIEIARFHREHDEAAFTKDLPELLEIIGERTENLQRRAAAIDLLAGVALPPAVLEEATSLLITEIRKPQETEYGMDTLSNAIRTLTSFPDAKRHLDLITGSPEIARKAFRAGFDAIATMTAGREDAKLLLANYLKPRFTACSGNMNELFLLILTHDLRPLAPELAGFASESPAVPDGDGADYSGGGFKSPIGHRYHLAREITALWSETDPATLGRMWIFFTVAHAHDFQPNDDNALLREAAASAISQMPLTERREAIDTALNLKPVPPHAVETERWLRTWAEP